MGWRGTYLGRGNQRNYGTRNTHHHCDLSGGRRSGPLPGHDGTGQQLQNQNDRQRHRPDGGHGAAHARARRFGQPKRNTRGHQNPIARPTPIMEATPDKAYSYASYVLDQVISAFGQNSEQAKEATNLRKKLHPAGPAPPRSCQSSQKGAKSLEWPFAGIKTRLGANMTRPRAI